MVSKDEEKLLKLRDLVEEARNTNNQLNNAVNDIDRKIVTCFTFTGILLALFVEFVTLPFSQLGVVLFVIVIFLLLFVLFLLMISYSPKLVNYLNFGSIIKKVNSADSKFKTRIGTNEQILGTISQNNTDLVKTLDDKSKFLFPVLWLLFISIILIILLIIYGG